MVILGLTGSIGMGKSTAAKAFRKLGVPVFEADEAVHRLFARGGAAVAAVAERFPEVVRDGAVDREALARLVFEDRDALRRLEAIVHPLVRAERQRFLSACARRREPLVVLDIPLLFETGADALCDAVVVVSAPAPVQWRRVLRRRGMTPERFRAIARRQMADAEKRRRADFVVWTGLGRSFSFQAIKRVTEAARRRRGTRWPPWPRRPVRRVHARNCPGYRNHRPRPGHGAPDRRDRLHRAD